MALTVNDFQRRIANTSVTPSALRNQGAKGILPGAREFLSKVNVGKFADVRDERSFQEELDGQTEMLRPITLSWGGARKVLNIFLCESYYNLVLHNHYRLEPMGPFLEVALDSLVAGRLHRDAEMVGLRLPRFDGVKYLTPEVSCQYQEFALRQARESGLELRVHLEIRYWRQAS